MAAKIVAGSWASDRANRPLRTKCRTLSIPRSHPRSSSGRTSSPTWSLMRDPSTSERHVVAGALRSAPPPCVGDLRRGHVAMAQQFRYLADVHPGVEEQGGGGGPPRMRRVD